MESAAANLGAIVGLSVALLACSRIAGIDDYAVGSPPIENPCGSLYVPAPDAPDGCQLVGVAACAAGFAPENGGCVPVLPDTPCDPGTAALPGMRGWPCPVLTVSSCEFFGAFAIIKQAIGTTLYVDPIAASEGTGSMEQPFKTITAALDAVPGDVSLALGAGTFHEQIVVTNRRVQIVGRCYTETAISAPVGSVGAVITLGPGADGSRVERVEIAGGTRGISVHSSTDVQIEQVWVHDVEGRGIAFEPPEDIVERLRAGETVAETADTALSGSVAHSLIENVRDAGISARGADLSIRSSVVRDTRTREDGDGGGGIVTGLAVLYPSNDLESWRRAHVSVDGCVIQGNHEAGIWGEVSDVTVSDSVILDTRPDRDGQGRGIYMIGPAAGLIADGWTTTLELSRSVVAGSYDVGVSLWNADAKISNTVIHDVGEGQHAPCLGNGVRARFDFVPALAEGLRVSHSLIERTRQAAVHLEGGSSAIDTTIIRETGKEPCRDDFGDGVVLFESASAGSIAISQSRIETSARAAVASFGGKVTLDAAVLDCNGRGLVGPPSALSTTGSFSGCGGGWERPMAADEAIDPSLFGVSGCQAPDGTLCSSQTLRVLPAGGANSTLWVADHDEIASVIADAQGYAVLAGLPAGANLNLQTGHDGAITTVMPRLVGTESNVQPADASSPDVFGNFMWPLSIGASTELVFDAKFDTRRSTLNIWLLEATPDGCLVDLPGYQTSLSPGPSVGPVYGSQSQFPAPELASSEGGTAYFVDVVPGEHELTFSEPAGKRIDCSHINPFTRGWGAAWESENRNSVRVRVAPGTIVQVRVYCRVDPPSQCPPPAM